MFISRREYGKAKLWILLTLAVVSIAAWFWMGSFSQDANTAQPKPSDLPNPSVVSSNEANQSTPSAINVLRPFVSASTPSEPDGPHISRLLEGTQIDGALTADADGNLIVNLELRDFFEYFLNTQIDVGIGTVIAEIKRYAETYLPSPAREQVAELLEQYIEYKTVNLQIMDEPFDPNKPLDASEYAALMRTTFDRLAEVQQSIFGAETSEAFFGLENAYAEFSVYSMEVQSDKSLSTEEQLSLIDYNRSLLPAELYQTEINQINREARDAEVQQVLAGNEGSDTTKQALINLGYSEQNAENVIAQQTANKDFDKQYNAYRPQRDSLRASGLEGDELLAALVGLRQDYFTSTRFITKAHLRDLDELDL